MGRPSKLTDDVREGIAERVRNGEYPEMAARCEGVGSSAYYAWMAKGKKLLALLGPEEDAQDVLEPDRKYAELAEAVARAEAEFQSDRLTEARTAVDRDGNAVNALKLLERRDPARWGMKIDVKVRDDAVANVLEVLREGLDPEAFEAVLEVLHRADGEGGEGEAPAD